MCYAIGIVAFLLDATALGASSTSEFFTSIDFSDSNLWGKRPCFDLLDSGTVGGAGARYWFQYGGSDNDSVITNYATKVERELRYDRFSDLNPQPDYMAAGSANTGYAMIRAGAPLARTFGNVDEEGISSVVLVQPGSSGAGLFVDTLVRFYPCEDSVDTVPTIDVRNRAKFMCWLSAYEGKTNLVVTAGHYTLEGELVRANYVVTNQVEEGRWYRLTARALADASTGSSVAAPAFVLYLDGVPVACAEDDYLIGDDQSAMDEQFNGNEFYSHKALFPPICLYTGQNPSLSGFAVAGRADFDEFAAMNDRNPMDREVTELEVAVACDPALVTNVYCTVEPKGGEVYFKTNTYGIAEVRFMVKPGDLVRVKALPNVGVSLKELVLSGNPDAIDSQDGYAFTLVSGSTFASAARITARITTGGALYRVGDSTYETFPEAVVAASKSGETLNLESDIDLDVDADNGQMRVRSIYTVRMDLKGHVIKGSHFQSEAAIYDQGRLEIFDSVGGGQILAPGDAIAVVSDNDALDINHRIAAVTLGSTADASGFSVRGRVRVTQGELTVKGGTYLTPPALEPLGEFYLGEYLASERFGAEVVKTETIGAKLCNWWQVSFDGRYLVRYTSEYGTVSPAFTNVDTEVGAKLIEPRVEAPGYAVTNWLVTGTGGKWSFATDEVTGDMTLLAQQELSRYTIVYDRAVSAYAPTSYSVEDEKTLLPEPTETYFTFDGWQDRVTGAKVRQVGAGATFVGTENTVTGNLDLVAIWLPKTLRWENTSQGLVESNGCYCGTWDLVVPTRTEMPYGTRIAIDEICFGVVNPLTFPLTAPCLKIVTAARETVVSAVREDHYDPETTEYRVGGNLLANGRARLAYKFDNLVVELGKTNKVSFTDASGTASVSGFLRLAHRPAKDDPLFTNCAKTGAPGEFERYEEYCPSYEVSGHAIREVTP